MDEDLFQLLYDTYFESLNKENSLGTLLLLDFHENICFIEEDELH